MATRENSGGNSKGEPVWVCVDFSLGLCGFVQQIMWVCVDFCLDLCGKSCGFMLIFVWLDFGLDLG